MEKGMRFGKRDILFLTGLIAAGVLMVFLLRVSRPRGGTAVVRVSGRVYGSYALDTDQTLEITGKDGGTNLLVIEDGGARILEASCPDHLCVRQGTVSRQGGSIVCLPNEVVVEITGQEKELPYDIVAG